MTLSLHDLAEWRRQEKEIPGLCLPPPLPDIKALRDQLMQEAGPDPRQWDADCEALAAREILEDPFRIRRGKLARACELNPDDASLPAVKAMYPFESNIWFHLTEGYRMLDFATQEVLRKGEWSGKWRPDKPNQRGPGV